MPTVPQSIEAEQSVIGGILVHARIFPEVAAIIGSVGFYHPAHRAIFEAMAQLDHDSKPIDALTVLEAMRGLETVDKLRALNGPDYLTELMGRVITVENYAYHARIVREKSELRSLAAALSEINAAIYADDADHGGTFALAERRFLDITTLRRRAGGPIDIKTGMKRVITAVEWRYENRFKGIDKTAVPTGIADIDHAMKGLKPGQLVILAARPGVGKTALKGNIIESASGAGVGCLDFSLEMPTEELHERLIASNGVSSDNLRSGHMSNLDFARMTTVAGRLASEFAIWTDDASDCGSLSLSELRSRARRWRMHEGAKFERVFIAVDYLQLVHGDESRSKKGSNRQEEVAEVSRGLKALAKELRCPVLALSQLNRAAEARTNKRPTMADLRESGQIEQDADLIWLLYRDEMHDPNSSEKGIAELNIAKHRGGPTGMFKLGWDEKQTRFRNLTKREY